MSNPDLTGQGSDGAQFGPTDQDPAYGYQTQYGTYPGLAAPQYGSWQQRPPDYRAWIIAAIVGGVLFNIILGVPLGSIAQRSSRQVRSKWESGDHDGAARASSSARSWLIASLVLDALGLLLFIVLVSHSGHSTS